MRRLMYPARWPLAAVIAIILIAAFEYGFIWKNRHRLWHTNYSLLDVKRTALRTGPADDADILGMSRFYHIDPAAVAKALGVKRVSNYSWASCGMETYQVMLQALIDSGRKPRTLIVDGFPEMFSYRPELLSASGDEMNRLRYRETVALWPAIKTACSQRDYLAVHRLLEYNLMPPSMRYADRVKRGLKSLKGKKSLPDLPDDYPRMVEQWQASGWFVFPPPGRAASDQDFIDLERETHCATLKENRTAQETFERFLALAGQENISVIMLPVPNTDRAYAQNQANGVFAAHDAWLNSLETRFPHFSAPQPRHMQLPGMFGDATHVNAAGAQAHMDLLLPMLEKYSKK